MVFTVTAPVRRSTRPSRQKLESEPPKPLPTQKYGPEIVESVYDRPLSFRSQGKHTYGGGAIIMAYVPEHCRREVGPKVEIDGLQVRKVPRTYEVVEPLVVASHTPPQARYDGTKRLHALGWFPPSCKRPEDESAVLDELYDGFCDTAEFATSYSS